MPLGEFGAGFVVRELDGDGNLVTEEVQILRRRADGSMEEVRVVKEPVEHTFLTLEEAVAEAVAMTKAGQEVELQRAIDGRSGSTYGRETMCHSDLLALIVREAGSA